MNRNQGIFIPEWEVSLQWFVSFIKKWCENELSASISHAEAPDCLTQEDSLPDIRWEMLLINTDYCYVFHYGEFYDVKKMIKFLSAALSVFNYIVFLLITIMTFFSFFIVESIPEYLYPLFLVVFLATIYLVIILLKKLEAEFIRDVLYFRLIKHKKYKIPPLAQKIMQGVKREGLRVKPDFYGNAKKNAKLSMALTAGSSIVGALGPFGKIFSYSNTPIQKEIDEKYPKHEIDWEDSVREVLRRLKND